MIFPGNIVDGEVGVAQCHFDVGMPHEFLDNGKRNALTDHVGTESVTEAMRVGFFEGRDFSPMPEDRPQSPPAQGLAPMGSFQDDEAFCVSNEGTFELEILSKRLPDGGSDGKDSFLAALAMDADLDLNEVDVVHVHGEDFTRAKPAEDHERGDGLVTIFSEASEESSELEGRQSCDQDRWDFDGECFSQVLQT